MNKIFLIIASVAFLISCGSSETKMENLSNDVQDADSNETYIIKNRAISYIGLDETTKIEEDEDVYIETEIEPKPRIVFNDNSEVVIDESFVYVTESVAMLGKAVKCVITADFPIKGNENLKNNIKTYINSILGKEKFDDQREMLGYYVNSQYDDLIVTHPEEVSPEYYNNTDIRIDNTTDYYITYLGSIEGYGGGAHGYMGMNSATFRKSDGEKLTWDMFGGKTPELMSLIKDGLKKYFGDDKILTDEELNGCLFDEDFNLISLPSCNPYFSKEGLEIHYGQYEIAAYAYGQPHFTIPFETAKKYLKEPGFFE